MDEDEAKQVTGRPLAATPRIARRTTAQRRHLPRVGRQAAALERLASTPNAAVARSAIESALAPLRRALADSPYYRRRFLEGGFAPCDLRTLGDLGQFPTIDRVELERHWRELPAFGAGPDPELFAALSSGTTGAPVTVVKDGYDGIHMWAVLRFWLRQLAIYLPPRPRVVLLCSLPGGLCYSVRLPLLHDGALHRISLVRPEPWRRLEKANPAVVFADPAGLHWLVAQPPLRRVGLILSSAQHLSDELRIRVVEHTGAPVLDYYATTETGPIAWRCPDVPSSCHVLAPDVWVESIEGDLVVTRLRESVLPLLRYRTGDRGTVRRDACPCGFHGWSIEGFEGRRACAFTTPDGATVDAWQLAFIFKHFGLGQFRLVQLAPQRFRLALDPEIQPGSDQLVDRLVRALALMGFPNATVERVALGSAGMASKPEPFVGLGSGSPRI